MKRTLAVIGLALVALSVFVWRLPATVVLPLLAPDAMRFVKLHHIEGTIWHGNTLFSVSGVPSALPLQWRCAPSVWPVGTRCEVTGAISAQITLLALTASATVERMTATLPLAVTAGSQPVARSPMVMADVASAELSRERVAVKGVLRATDATYRAGATDLLLGEVSLDCAPSAASGAPGAAGITACTLSNRGGNARLDGRLQLTSRGAGGSVELTPAGGTTQRIAF